MFSHWTCIISGAGRRNEKAEVRDIQFNLLLAVLESIPNVTRPTCPLRQQVDGHWELSLSTQSSSLWAVPSFWLWNPLQTPLLGNSSLQNWKAMREHSDIIYTTPARKALGELSPAVIHIGVSPPVWPRSLFSMMARRWGRKRGFLSHVCYLLSVSQPHCLSIGSPNLTKRIYYVLSQDSSHSCLTYFFFSANLSPHFLLFWLEFCLFVF